MTEKPPIVIKKYANRRLYNTDISAYITLEHLAAMVRQGKDFKVVDAKTADDITRSVLTQIIVEEEGRGHNMLPVNFLRQLIGLYGDGMQSVVPQYLDAAMKSFRTNQEQVQKMFSGSLVAKPFSGTPFEKLAEQNLAMMQAAAKLFAAPLAKAETAKAEPETDDEIAHLKTQMAAMQDKINSLVKK